MATSGEVFASECIGMKFALTELKCSLAVLLSNFDLKTVEDSRSFTYEPALTMAVKGPLMVNVTPLVGSAAVGSALSA